MKKKQGIKVAIVIPNYNGLRLLKKNLPFVVDASLKNQIIIVDDGSQDASVDYIKKAYPQIHLLEKVTNSGYASAVNLGVKAAAADIVVLLNTDVKPEKDFLTSFLIHFSDPNVFAVGCMELSQEQGRVIERGRGVGSFINGFLIHSKGETNKKTTLWASGGAAAFRVSLWRDFGGMDELFDPFYWEDIDLSYRALKSGYSVIFEPHSRVHHLHLEGVIQTQFTPSQIKTIAYRNQLIFHWKNISSRDYLHSHLLHLPLHLFKSLVKGDLAFIHGFLLALQKLGEIKSQRRKSLKFFKLSDESILGRFSSDNKSNK